MFFSRLIFICLCSIITDISAANISRTSDTVSGQPGWIVQDGIIEIQLNPLTPDQSRGFYLGRGFSTKIANLIAQQCVFQIVIKNIAKTAASNEVKINLSNWKTHINNISYPLTTKTQWLENWSSQGESASAILAFRWATFPWEQNFTLPGDFAWGMLLFGSLSGAPFDVTVAWAHNDKYNDQRINDLSCL